MARLIVVYTTLLPLSLHLLPKSCSLVLYATNNFTEHLIMANAAFYAVPRGLNMISATVKIIGGFRHVWASL